MDIIILITGKNVLVTTCAFLHYNKKYFQSIQKSSIN